MQKNLNRKDAILRSVLGIAAIALFFMQVINDEVLELILGIIGLMLLISAIIEFCPIYYLLGIKTRQKRRKKFY